MKNQTKISTRIANWLKDLFAPQPLYLREIENADGQDISHLYRYWPPVFIPEVGCIWMVYPDAYERIVENDNKQAYDKP